jgi:hypothetical protein
MYQNNKKPNGKNVGKFEKLVLFMPKNQESNTKICQVYSSAREKAERLDRIIIELVTLLHIEGRGFKTIEVAQAIASAEYYSDTGERVKKSSSIEKKTEYIQYLKNQAKKLNLLSPTTKTK